MTPEATKKLKLLAYVTAWIAYAGAFLTQCSNISAVVRDSFGNIHIPKKEDFLE
jgi:hypothetical protein